MPVATDPLSQSVESVTSPPKKSIAVFHIGESKTDDSQNTQLSEEISQLTVKSTNEGMFCQKVTQTPQRINTSANIGLSIMNLIIQRPF